MKANNAICYINARVKKQGVSVRGLLACGKFTWGCIKRHRFYGTVTYFPETAGGKYYLPQAPTSALCLAEPRLAGNLRGTRNETRAKEGSRSYNTPGGRISVSDESRCLAAAAPASCGIRLASCDGLLSMSLFTQPEIHPGILEARKFVFSKPPLLSYFTLCQPFPLQPIISRHRCVSRGYVETKKK